MNAPINAETGEVECMIEGCEHGRDPNAGCGADRLGVDSHTASVLVGAPDSQQRDVMKGCSALWGYAWIAVVQLEECLGHAGEVHATKVEFLVHQLFLLISSSMLSRTSAPPTNSV